MTNTHTTAAMLAAPNLNAYIEANRESTGDILNELAHAFNSTGTADLVLTFSIDLGTKGLMITGDRPGRKSRMPMATWFFRAKLPTPAVLACICGEVKMFDHSYAEDRMEQIIGALHAG